MFQIIIRNVCVCRDSLVGVATCCGLDGAGIQFWVEARLFAPVQIGPVSHLASYTMDIASLSWQ